MGVFGLGSFASFAKFAHEKVGELIVDWHDVPHLSKSR